LFIDQLAALLMPMGVPPIAARMHGLLFVALKALTLDEIVAILGVSKSSVSVAARVLERNGVAHRVTQPGTKRVRYCLSERCAGFLFEQVEFLGKMVTMLRKRANRSKRDQTSLRLNEIASFFLRVRNALDAALREI
jgi:hypothetical protein